MKRAILVSDRVEADCAEALEEAAPGVPRVVARAGEGRPDSTGVEIAYFSGDLYPERTREFAIAALKADALAWLHSFSAGIDNEFFQTLLRRGVRITTSSGAQAVPIAQTVMMYLLAFSRDLRGWLDAQARRVWDARGIRDLQGCTLGVVGLGPIGLEVARLGAAFGMRVRAVRRQPRGDEPCETWPLARLPELLAQSDYVVLALALSDETRGLIDAEALRTMRSEAVLVNIARGEIVDEPALVVALQEGWIAGAALDVFEQEPLPEESPLWSLPNVIVTPHSSGTNPGNQVRATEIFLDNLARYRRGEPLRNEVTPP
ncbi:MAG: D-2-hydroxyacid dehydrogenase [Proteobacteria bacterium]|nr:D-2-hydroxyacid dehydrogenase [Pseudomonadota bacterium]